MIRLNFRIFKHCFILFCTVFFLHPISLFAQDKIVAVVNQDAITQKDLDDFINFMRLELAGELKQDALKERLDSLKEDLLDRLIEDRLILQEAQVNGVAVDENVIKGKINDIRKMYNSEAELRDGLISQGLSISDIEQRIREQLMMRYIVEAKVRKGIVINPKDVTAFYNQNINKFVSEEIRDVEVLDFVSLQEAQDFSNKLNNGARFEDLIEARTQGFNRLDIAKSELSEEVEKEVFGLGTGAVSKPIEANQKFYIFRVLSIAPSRQFSLKEVQGRINDYLFELKMQEKMGDWLDGLKEKSYIKILQN